MKIIKTDPVLVVEDLIKVFISKKFFKKSEAFTAVNKISFELQEGEILGLLGPNGAGKTTTIQMLLGLLTQTSGSISYFGKDFFTHRSEIMEHISFASSYLKLPGSLTVAENLDMYGKIYCLPKDIRKERIEKNMNFFGISKMANKLTKYLSAGQLTRLMLAKVFLPNPKVVLLDEPTAALDPDIAHQIRKFILQERETSGISMLFTSHNMAEVEQVCDRVLVLKEGQIIASGNPQQLASQVKIAHVQLLISAGKDKLVSFLDSEKIPYKLNGDFVDIDSQEEKIADLLSSIGALNIKYSQISINKPTLEDYFMQIAKK